MTAITTPITFSLRHLPEQYHDEAKAYLACGTDPGSLLRACLENRLVDAWGQAGPSRLGWDNISEICHWLYWECPSEAWGNESKVSDWMRERRNRPYERVEWRA